MRWLTFFILAYVATVLQSTLLGLMTGATAGGATVNLLFVLALYYALSARKSDAPWACMALGLMADLASSYPFGVYAAAFAVAGWGITRIRSHLVGEHPLSVLFMSFILTFLLEVIVGTVALARLGGSAPWGRLMLTALLTAVFTAVAAVPVHWLLRRNRSRRMLGMPAGRTA